MKKCKYASRCGGCTYMGNKYEDQLAAKQKMVNDLIRPFGPVKPVIGAANPYNYRNKVHAVVGGDRNGNYADSF